MGDTPYTMMHAHRALLAAAVLAACASGTAVVAVPVPCCAKFYGESGTCAASACPNKFGTVTECKAACAGDGSTAAQDCERDCDTWICRNSIGADGRELMGKIDCITWGGLADGTGIKCLATDTGTDLQGTAIKMSDNNGVGCPGYTGDISKAMGCERSITTDLGPPEVTEQLDEAACNAVGCCMWSGSMCLSTVTGGDVCPGATRADTTWTGEGKPICPGRTPDKYCDCLGDCDGAGNTNCDCPEAEKCCAAGKTSPAVGSSTRTSSRIWAIALAACLVSAAPAVLRTI